jgi:hypothetical protein
MKVRSLFGLLLLLIGGAAYAGECTDNRFNPTFVRHNAVSPTVFYVGAGMAFTPMSDPNQAQQTCQAGGVRQLITGQDCNARNWGDFGCGCNYTPSNNGTCAAFQGFLRAQGLVP